MRYLIVIIFMTLFTTSDKKNESTICKVESGGVYNPSLAFVHAPAGWTGNRINSRNQFLNPDTIQMPKLKDILKWKLNKNPQEQEKKDDTSTIEVVNDTSFLNSGKDVMVWLGHSTFFFRINNISFITDPVFYDIPFVKRHHNVPFDPSFLNNLDYILISHNHRDHLDKKSLKLLSKHNPQAVILTGLETEKLISKWIPNKVQSAGWYQKYNTEGNSNIVFLPAHHWSKRGLTDTNKRLWGSFSITIGSKKIYFAGDTRWGNHFEYIGSHFGPFDYCIIPIGAYAPRWFMKSSHINTVEAAQSFKALNGKKFIVMHYGTYDLSDEPMGEPLKLIKQEFIKTPEIIISPAAGSIVDI